MVRHAFSMKIKHGAEAEYTKRHDEVWPEMGKVLKEAGASNYSIFRKGLVLFAYVELENMEKWNALPKNPVVQKWWDYMADIMDVNPDNSPVSESMEQVFFLD